jgi:hypothetical protein
MNRSLKPGSFEDFVRWLAESNRPPHREPVEPPPEVLAAARAAWDAFQSVQREQRESLGSRIRTGRYYEEVELMAAADADRNRWLPRLRTPNGFAISALYPADSPSGSAPVGLLVECPVDLIEVFKGQKVHIAASGRWVEIGEIDIDGKATGDLPKGIDFKPPFTLRVGDVAEQPTELRDPNESA